MKSLKEIFLLTSAFLQLLIYIFPLANTKSLEEALYSWSLNLLHSFTFLDTKVWFLFNTWLK